MAAEAPPRRPLRRRELTDAERLALLDDLYARVLLRPTEAEQAEGQAPPTNDARPPQSMNGERDGRTRPEHIVPPAG